jgi:hypothetical protein
LVMHHLPLDGRPNRFISVVLAYSALRPQIPAKVTEAQGCGWLSTGQDRHVGLLIDQSNHA